MIINKKNNVNEYSIGVVTYHARFEKYFIPLIEKLTSVFPDKEILCVINGHPDRTLQINYLNKVTAFLSKFKNVRYLTYDQHQSLSKCWNQLMILSGTEKVLVMNDDTQVTDLFRQEFEEKVIDKNFSTINTSWSHFLVSKEIIKKVGWFDERLLGVGHEDIDFGLRMGIANIPITNSICLGINNFVVDQENPGWKNISQKSSDNKYSLTNLEFFNKKWIIQSSNTANNNDFKYTTIWGNSTYHFSPTSIEPTPMFYDYSCLETKKTAKNNYPIYIGNKFKLGLEKIFFVLKQILKKIYRKIIS